MEFIQFDATLMFGCFLGALAVLASVKQNGIQMTQVQLAVAGILAIVQLVVFAIVPSKYSFGILVGGFVIGPYLFSRFQIAERLMNTVGPILRRLYQKQKEEKKAKD